MKAHGNKIPVVSESELAQGVADRLHVKAEVADSDDDDDDLDPVESFEAPPKTAAKVTYVRDFLDGEFKTFDEMSAALRSLPDVIRHQLPLEHDQVALDVLDRVFRSVCP